MSRAYKSKTRLVGVSQKIATAKHCCVPRCNSNGIRHPHLTFHKFPSQENTRRAWIYAIRRDPGPYFKITEHTVVCSKHFRSTDFKWTPVRHTLKPGSIPSIFSWTEETTPRRDLFRHPLPEKRARKELDFSGDVDSTNTHVVDTDACLFENEVDGKMDDIQKKNDRIVELEELLKKKEEEIQGLRKKIEIERFGIQRFSNDNSMILFYTGFVSLAMFVAVFDYLKPAANSMHSYYYRASEKVNEQSIVGRQRNMLLIDEFFMFLCRLKCGLMEQDLAVRFNCHMSTVSRKIITWANFLYFAFGSINIWPSRQKVNEKMPNSFKLTYPHTRVIIDCTEIKTERPSSLALGSKCYSSYKSAYTWKGLVGIAPHGALSFVSNLYTGSMSDVEITKLSGLIDLLESGDSIMADKGFVLNKVLDGTGISVNTPPFLMSQGQFTKQEVERTETIAKLRIHVERHIRRVKEYHLFDGVIPLSMVGTINQLWTVANLLTLFKGPLVKEWYK